MYSSRAMSLSRGLSSSFIILLILTVFSCKKAASDTAEACRRLLAVKNWKISEIYVDDVVRFKGGKLIPDFGGVDIGRYMDNVAFNENGFFIGYFVGDSVPLKLKYVVKSEAIVLTDANPEIKGGEWRIVPGGVTEDSFEMTTATKAYNFPSTTTVRLLFKVSE